MAHLATRQPFPCSFYNFEKHNHFKCWVPIDNPLVRASLGIIDGKTRSKIILAIQLGDFQLGCETTLHELKHLIKEYESGRKGGGPSSEISPREKNDKGLRSAKQGDDK